MLTNRTAFLTHKREAFVLARTLEFVDFQFVMSGIVGTRFREMSLKSDSAGGDRGGIGGTACAS